MVEHDETTAHDDGAEDSAPDDNAAGAGRSTSTKARPDALPAGPTRASGLWWKILLFAGGVLVGVVGVGLLNVTTPDFATAAAGPAAAGSGQPGGTVPSGVEARVNAACLGVINDAQDVYAVLGDVGPALDEVDLTALDDIVRRLQPIEPRLARDLTGCRVDTTVTSGGTGPSPEASSATAAPTPSTSPSPLPSATR